MADTVYDEETRLPELLDRVEQGEEVTIARQGAPVARLVPLQPKPPERDERKIRDALRRMDERSKHMSLGGLRIRDMVNEGRK